MKLTAILALGLLGGACVAAVAAKNDVTVMTIGNRNVPLSEFEYLYNKNKSQQEKPVSLDEYVDMFVDYKLKVLAAEAAGMDTMAKVRGEIERSSEELASKYLIDTTVVNRLVGEAYDRMLTDVDISHILLSRQHYPDCIRRLALADSLYALIADGTTIDSLAVKYSDDRNARVNHGHIGYLASGSLPYQLELAAWNATPGQTVKPVDTRFGTVILKVNGRRQAIGRIRARHILVAIEGGTKADTLAALARADSLRTVLTGGADFNDVARRLSSDPSARQNGGELRWFGSGQMVREFENAAFALADGEISQPVLTRFGYHLIQREEGKPVGTLEQERQDIERAMNGDERGVSGQRACLDRTAARIGARRYGEAAEAARDSLRMAADLQAVIAALRDDHTLLAEVGGAKIAVADIALTLSGRGTPEETADLFVNRFNDRYYRLLGEQGRRLLKEENIDYANLINEYRDGLLLCEISEAEVWDKGTSDRDGLRKYYEQNRDKYLWDAPRYKGYVLLATTDAVADSARDLLSRMSPSAPEDSLQAELRRHYGNSVRLERVLAPRGANAIIDYVGFGGERPKPVGRWTSFVPFRQRLIAQPEEVDDVKAAVGSDYQHWLEKNWVQRLRKTYPVKINRKALDRLR